MKKIKIYAEVPDDFEKGCCYDCPFSYTEYYEIDEGDGFYEIEDTIHCVLLKAYSECPIEIVKEE